MSEQLSWPELVNQIGEWSQANFGDNQSKVRPETTLNEVAPLLGLMEEVAYEYNLAGMQEDHEGGLDAVADAAIFLADFWYRWGGDADKFVPPSHTYLSYGDLLLCTGRLCHLVLKAHQGIRYTRDRLEEKITEAVTDVLAVLDSLCRQRTGRPLLELVNEVWAKVRERNWRKDALSGGERKQGCGKSSCGCSGSQSRQELS